jgi:hypothetical protein
VRGPAVQASVLKYRLGKLEHRRGARPVGRRRSGLLRRRRGADAGRARDPEAHGRRGAAICGLANPSPRCRAASGSGSSSRRTWVKMAASTCSTSRPPGCTWPTSSSARSAGPAGRLGQVGHRDRAPPVGDGARRLDHRPRAGRGPRRRADRFEGTTADLVAARSTLTGEHLAAFVDRRAKAVPSR